MLASRPSGVLLEALNTDMVAMNHFLKKQKNEKIMQQNIKKSNKSISIFGICMFSIIAVDSIRALPINAAYGPALVSTLLLGGLLFLLPCALISAELASAWPQDGGLYVWVREAFGLKTAFVARCKAVIPESSTASL